MNPKYDNLFWWFEREEGEDDQRRLENNTTKALINLLNKSSGNTLTKILLDSAGLDEITENSKDYSFEYGIQKEPTENPEKNYLICLQYSEPDEVPLSDSSSKETSQKRSIADGVIRLLDENGDVVASVYIESKAGRNTVGSAQLNKYRNNLDLHNSNQLQFLTWPKLWKEFKNLYEDQRRNFGDLDQLLLSDFLNYLEIEEMVPFKGFTADALESGEYSEVKKAFRATKEGNLGSFAQELRDELGESNHVLEDFELKSNQDNRQLHLVSDNEDSPGSQNHFTAGFWDGQLNLQCWIKPKPKKKLYRRKDGEILTEEGFQNAVLDCLRNIEENVHDRTTLSEDSPITHISYNKTIPHGEERKRGGQLKTTNFKFFKVPILENAEKMDDDSILDETLGLLTETIYKYNNELDTGYAGSERNISLVKKIPFSSRAISDENLPEYTVEYFKALYPLYDYFEEG